MSLLILGASQIARKRLCQAVQSSKAFKRLEIASRRGHAGLEGFEGVSQVYSDYAKALETSDAQCVYISLINSEHEVWARRALESGRHVILDKPATLTKADAEGLVQLAARRNLGIFEATVWPFHPQIPRLQTVLENIGGARRAAAFFSVPPFTAENFRWRPELGGGVIHDLGPYAASIGRILFGGLPQKIIAEITAQRGEVPVAFSCLMRWSGGQTLVGHFGFDTEYINRLEVLGEAGRIEIDRIFTTPIDFANPLRIVRGDQAVEEKLPSGDSFSEFFKAVVTDIKTKSLDSWREALLQDAQIREEINQ